MANGFLERSELLIGGEALDRLSAARVAVFGVGGVGGHAVEALVRAGVGEIDLFDPDTVSESNINRQLFALQSTVGRLKVEVAAERARDINPAVKIGAFPLFYLPENADIKIVPPCVDNFRAECRRHRLNINTVVPQSTVLDIIKNKKHYEKSAFLLISESYP